jgi:hypothetical protein
VAEPTTAGSSTLFRTAAAAAVLLGVTILMLYLDEAGTAPWSTRPERHLRAMKQRTAVPDRYETITFAEMTALPRDATFDQYAAIERRAVSLEGYVQRIVHSPDTDIHLDFTDTVDVETRRLQPFLSAEVSPEWHLDSPRWRFERLVALFRPTMGGPTRWDQPPVRARLSGWLLYDYPHDEDEKAVPGFPKHLTRWEIHPVTRIETWDDSLRRFVELPR